MYLSYYFCHFERSYESHNIIDEKPFAPLKATRKMMILVKVLSIIYYIFIIKIILISVK